MWLMQLCNNKNSAVLQETGKNTLFLKWLASGYLISLFGLGIVKKFLSGARNADKFLPKVYPQNGDQAARKQADLG